MEQEREWLTVPEASRRMDVTEDEIVRLAKARVLRSRNLFGIPEVEPAIVPGVRRNSEGEPAASGPLQRTKPPLSFPWRSTQRDEQTDDPPTW